MKHKKSSELKKRGSHWFESRLQMVESLKKKIESFLGKETAEIKKYRTDYEKPFRFKKWKVVSKEQLFKKLGMADIVYLGDFHASPQSQRSHLRLLKHFHESQPKRKLILALECFQAKDQKKIDLYMDGRKNEGEFLSAIRWKRTWGFSWSEYRSLMKWAVDKNALIFGLNTDKKNSSLKNRDKFSAKILQRIKLEHPEALLVVIYGEWHLASKHLPLEVRNLFKKKITDLKVYQCVDQIYLELGQKGLEHTVDLVKFNEGEFALVNIPPWVKHQNYLTHLEKEIFVGEGESDLQEEVVRYVEFIGKDLGLKTEISFEVFSKKDGKMNRMIRKHFQGVKQKQMLAMVRESRTFYVPEMNWLYVGKVSINHLAHAASLILYFGNSESRAFITSERDHFCKLIWIEALVYFGSKIVNPKRKTDTLKDIKSETSLQQREVLRLALQQKMAELDRLRSERSVYRSPKGFSEGMYRETAKILGALLGEKIYFGMRQRYLSKEVVQKMYRYSVDNLKFEQFYFEMLSNIDLIPEPFASKREKL